MRIGSFSPAAVHDLIIIAVIALAPVLVAVILAVRDARRRTAHRALAAARVPDLAAAMRGEPYRALADRLAQAVRQADDA